MKSRHACPVCGEQFDSSDVLTYADGQTRFAVRAIAERTEFGMLTSMRLVCASCTQKICKVLGERKPTDAADTTAGAP